MRRLVSILVALALASTGCPSLAPRSSDGFEPSIALALGRQSACQPTFEDQDGWLGGDVAASIPLPGRSGRASVWLFGDSFPARAGSATERTYPFVHNAVAVSHCDAGGHWSIEFALGRVSESAGQPGEQKHASKAASRAFFEPDPAADWVERVRATTGAAPYYWPISGAVVDDTLFVALLRIAPSAAHGPFQLPFRPVGVDLARIEAPDGPPENWRIRYSALSSRPDLLPVTSLVATPEYLFAFASVDRGDGHDPRTLTRLPASILSRWRSDLEPFLETLATDGNWRAGIDLGEARILMADDASEMSVHFDPGLGEWLAVYVDPTLDAEGESDSQNVRADAIWLRRASRIEGPWSSPVVLARIPELADREDPLPGEPFCYAGKAHPELAPSGRLLVTYVCNFWAAGSQEIAPVLERLRRSPSFYRPRVLQLFVPPAVDQT